MADFTASTGIRDLLATSAASYYYWITLHTGAQTWAASDTYSAGTKGEHTATNSGYTQGAKTLTLTNTNGVLDGADATWTAGSAGINSVTYAAVWVNSTNSITGAKPLSVKDSSASPQSSTSGQTFTAGIANPLTIPTPA